FLREIQQRSGGGGGAGGWEKLGNLATMASDLRRVSALQTEFGAFTSLKTLSRPRGRACWNTMREGLVTLEEYLHGDNKAGSVPSAGGKDKKTAAAAPASGGAKKGGGPGGGSSARRATASVLPRLLHRARRLSELLGVAWTSVVSHLANEAATRGKVPEAVGLCHMLFRDQATTDERAAALALRDTAKALSTFVANQAHMGALRADDLEGERARTAVLQAMAQSVRGLRQSAVLCASEELPLTVDLLQASETVAAVLCRCEGGDKLEALMAADLSPSSLGASKSRSSVAEGLGNKIGGSGGGASGAFFMPRSEEEEME
ncbi:unnamed protein product, partial [Ectocarpus sp. 12 AP-2014]